jgi:hypothetical protein
VLAASIVGTVFNCSSTRRRKAMTASNVGYFLAGSRTRIVKRCDVSTPMSMRYRLRKLRIMKPAPDSSTSVSASSATMRAAVQRRARRVPVPERPPSFSASFGLVFEMCRAGARPKRIAVSTHAPAKNVTT